MVLFYPKRIGQDIIFGLAGNKTDLILEEGYSEEVTPDEGKAYAEKINAIISLVSAKERWKEISNLIEQLVERYIETKLMSDEPLNNISIKLSDGDNNSNKKDCCSGISKKTYKLYAVFLGSNGVGKTSIIKAIKGNKNINKTVHTKKTSKEKIIYNKNGQKITVQLKDTNGDDYKDDIFDKAIEKCKIFFLVFDIYKKIYFI